MTPRTLLSLWVLLLVASFMVACDPVERVGQELRERTALKQIGRIVPSDPQAMAKMVAILDTGYGRKTIDAVIKFARATSPTTASLKLIAFIPMGAYPENNIASWLLIDLKPHSPEVIEAMYRMAGHQDPEVRIHLYEVLTACSTDTQRLLPILVQGTHSADRDEREVAVGHISTIALSDSKALEALMTVAQDKQTDPNVRGNAIAVISNCSLTPDQARVILKVLDDASSSSLEHQWPIESVRRRLEQAANIGPRKD
jgi:hypothetical protein